MYLVRRNPLSKKLVVDIMPHGVRTRAGKYCSRTCGAYSLPWWGKICTVNPSISKQSAISKDAGERAVLLQHSYH